MGLLARPRRNRHHGRSMPPRARATGHRRAGTFHSARPLRTGSRPRSRPLQDLAQRSARAERLPGRRPQHPRRSTPTRRRRALIEGRSTDPASCLAGVLNLAGLACAACGVRRQTDRRTRRMRRRVQRPRPIPQRPARQRSRHGWPRVVGVEPPDPQRRSWFSFQPVDMDTQPTSTYALCAHDPVFSVMRGPGLLLGRVPDSGVYTADSTQPRGAPDSVRACMADTVEIGARHRGC